MQIDCLGQSLPSCRHKHKRLIHGAHGTPYSLPVLMRYRGAVVEEQLPKDLTPWHIVQNPSAALRMTWFLSGSGCSVLSMAIIGGRLP